MSIASSIIEPNYARMLTGIDGLTFKGDIDYIQDFEKYGGGNYGFSTSIICLFPILIYYYRNNFVYFLKKKYIIFYLLILFISLVRMQIFANILISVFVIILSLISSNNRIKYFVFTVLLILFLLLIPYEFYISLLLNINSLFPSNSDIHFKINDLIKYFTYIGSIDTSLGARAARYPQLLQSFTASPIWGHYLSNQPDTNIAYGGHLYWMNKLAVYGLIGTLPILFIIYRFLKNNLSYFNREYSVYFLLSFLSIMALGLMKALSRNQMWYMLFVILPGMYYLPLLNKKRVSSKNKPVSNFKGSINSNSDEEK